MVDLVALLTGGAVGVLLGMAVLGIRRSRPLPAAPTAAPPRPAPAPRSAVDYPIHVNRPVPAPAPSVPAGARLDVTGGASVVLGTGPVTIGRGGDQVLRVEDERASRSHAVVRPRASGGWELADVGSANGTELNGHRIPDGRVAPLRDGDRIGVGGTIVSYREEQGPAAPGAPRPGPDATQVL